MKNATPRTRKNRTTSIPHTFRSVTVKTRLYEDITRRAQQYGISRAELLKRLLGLTAMDEAPTLKLKERIE